MPHAPTVSRPTYEHYRTAFQGERLPLAFIDMDLLDANALTLSARANPLPMRLATKSLRCVAVLHYLLKTYPAFQGLMAYSPAEAAFLHKEGFANLLLGYPTLAASEVGACLKLIKDGAWICFMIDDARQVAWLEQLANAHGERRIPVCLDLDMSMDLPGLRFGVYRSPVQSFKTAAKVLAALRQSPSLELQGVMGYEAQLAGIADAMPAANLYNLLLRFLKQRSQTRAFARRQRFVSALGQQGFKLRFVNGGGTGSIARTRLDSSVTELTVGSGLYSPGLFDHYQEFLYEPAAAFALPVVRQATASIYACAGGGYVASGPTNADKQPVPYLPAGIELIKTLGAGEVQTSLRSPVQLQLGDPVFFRHAKAGELCERFNELYLLRGGKIAQIVPTYRGQGQCFL